MGKKILFLSHRFYPDIGGIESISEILATEFAEAGHEVRVVTWSADPSQTAFPFSVIRNPNTGKLLQAFQWANLVFENNPCLRMSWPNLFFFKPSVIALHTWISSQDKALTLSERSKYFWLKRAKKVISVSNAIRQGCWQNSEVIGNPYQEQVFKKLPGVPRDLDFVFVGRLVSDKGISLAIKALHRLNIQAGKGRQKYTLTIIGDGEEKAELEGLTEVLNCQSQVSFKGYLRGDELARCLNRHRFILVPSVWDEPFGLVALEGMACGCVPIVSNAGGLPDAVGKAGAVFTRENLSSLVDCMHTLVDDAELVRHYQAEAAEQLAAHHTTQVAKKYLHAVEAS